ncbi:MAG: hypothetical protein AAGH15_28920 [Myxococcota bacterium]
MGNVGLGKAHCARCERETPVMRPWRGWRWALRGWVGVLVLLGILSPVLSADYCVMIPSAMLVMSAGGPLLRLAREVPTCRRCGAPIAE